MRVGRSLIYSVGWGDTIVLLLRGVRPSVPAVGVGVGGHVLKGLVSWRGARHNAVDRPLVVGLWRPLVDVQKVGDPGS